MDTRGIKDRFEKFKQQVFQNLLRLKVQTQTVRI